MILMPALSRPRSTNCLTNVRALPRRNEDEDRVGLLVRGALQEGREIGIGQRRTRIDSRTSPPFFLNFGDEGLFRVDARARSRRSCVTTFLMPLSAAQSAIGTVDWASVKLVRTM